MKDGVALLESFELLGFKDRVKDMENETLVNYDYNTGQIKNSDGSLSNYYIKLDENGRFDTDSKGNLVILDKNGNTLSPEFTPDGKDDDYPKFKFTSTDSIYSKNITNVKYEDIVKIYNN
jgi:hypothetical protein